MKNNKVVFIDILYYYKINIFLHMKKNNLQPRILNHGN